MNKDHIIFIIGRINYKADRFLIREMKAAGIKGLAPSHGEILGSVIFRGALTMKEIAEIIGKDKSTVTVLVNKLIRMGYIEKRKFPEDNRVSLIIPTKKGEALKPAFVTIAKKLRAFSYRGIAENERETLFNLLNRIDSNL